MRRLEGRRILLVTEVSRFEDLIGAISHLQPCPSTPLHGRSAPSRGWRYRTLLGEEERRITQMTSGVEDSFIYTNICLCLPNTTHPWHGFILLVSVLVIILSSTNEVL
jgi:hypothetical protein